MSSQNPLVLAHAAGQSLWLDYIQRSMLGLDLATMISEDHIMGMTSNPAIFEQAIAKSDEYDAQIAAEVRADPNISNLELFNRLAIKDIQQAADVFRETYLSSGCVDGMVSLEVPPNLAHDAAETVKAALDLHARVDRANVMIKVPGTKAGVEAVEELIAAGVNVNVTLLFSVQRYRAVALAFIRGLVRRHGVGGSIDRVQSVASFFVSRVDASIDSLLAEKGAAGESLQGKIAVANAKVVYGHFANLFGSPNWESLTEHGAQPQRLLWASTGTKNKAYSDVKYVEELIGPQTVNTVPPATLDAFRDHGTVNPTLTDDLATAHQQLTQLKELGISLDAVTDELEAAGIQSFVDAFDRLLESLDGKRKSLV